ncbi:AsmA family protein [Thiomicrorhabdus sp. Milos-T2]|uniref:AsmA family protein n=1 Tax=Thiomicrorhabdus sp. Milos-T2 TaxID=90814 RepID=UPI0004946950|nr:AsmA family protein [Thiomicrorhabdus sp. Milos-T2]
MTKTTIKWSKRAALVLAIIPILIFLAFAGAVSLIDFNQYKPQIEQEVKALTNRDFKIEGEVEVSVLPFKFHLGKMTLKNPSAFKEANLMTMKEAEIELSLKSLFLSKTLKVTSLELIEPKFNFIKQSNQNNWSNIPLLGFAEPLIKKMDRQGLKPQKVLAQMGLLKDDNSGLTKVVLNSENNPVLTSVSDPEQESLKSTAEHESNNTEIERPVSLGQVAENWKLESLVVKNAEINYSNVEQDFTVTLSQANLLAFDVVPNKPFKMTSDFVYKHSQSPRTFDFQLNSNLLLSHHYTQLHLANWHGVFRLSLPKKLNKPDIRLTTSGENFMVDFAHQKIFVNQAKLEGLDALVLMSFEGGFGANPVYEGVFEADKINLKKWINHLGLPAPKMVKKSALTEASGKFNWRWNGQVLNIEKLDAKLDKTEVLGRIFWPVNNQEAELDLKIKQLNTNDYLAQARLPINESNRPGSMTGNMSDAEVLSDDVLTDDVLTQQYYPIPLSFLQNLNASGSLTFEDLTVDQVFMKEVNLALNANLGKWQVAPLDIKFKQGRVESKLMADISKPNAELFWKGQVKDLALASVLSSSEVNQSEFLATKMGMLNSHFRLATIGKDFKEWLAHLKGSMNAELEQLKLPGLDINEILSGTLALNQDINRSTEFEFIKLDGYFNQGVFSPKRMLAKSKYFNATGTAKIDLTTQDLIGDVLLNISHAKTVQADLRGVSLPLTLSGKLSQPVWAIDSEALNPKLVQNSPSLKSLKSLLP